MLVQKLVANFAVQAFGKTVLGWLPRRDVMPLDTLILRPLQDGAAGQFRAIVADDAIAIRKWFVFSTLKNAFGGSSDTTLTRLRELLKACDPTTPFPADILYASLEIEPQLNEAEIDRYLGYEYQGRYTNLILSLLYPDRDWKDAIFHEDHIFPKSEFQINALKKRGYDEIKVQSYMSRYNVIPNLQLLSESENLLKNAIPFEEWLRTRDPAFLKRHLIPDLPNYAFDSFEEFSKERTKLIEAALKKI